MTLLKPLCTLKLVDCLENSLGTYSVSTMWVCKVTRKINLMRLDLIEKFYTDIYICLCTLAFLDTSGLVERKVEEMCIGLVVETE